MCLMASSAYLSEQGRPSILTIPGDEENPVRTLSKGQAKEAKMWKIQMKLQGIANSNQLYEDWMPGCLAPKKISRVYRVNGSPKLPEVVASRLLN